MSEEAVKEAELRKTPEMMSYKVRILNADNEISHTILFGGGKGVEEGTAVSTEMAIHPDDSIRTIKLKILNEMYNGSHSKKLQIVPKPAYEELYLYGYVEESANLYQLVEQLKESRGGEDAKLSYAEVVQLFSGHPNAKSILKKIPIKKTGSVPISSLDPILNDENLIISVRTPLGLKFAGTGSRDLTFTADPFAVEQNKSYESEHKDIVYFEDSLLLNYGTLVENTIYVCLASRVLSTTTMEEVEEYIIRYYYPGLYNKSVNTSEGLVAKRGELVKSTTDLLTKDREQYYQSINTFYKIANDETVQVAYLKKGVLNTTLRIKNTQTRVANLEMLFKNMHCSREIPYIKFNPGNRRENLYRFYFERTSRTGKKIPYLSKVQIMRMSKETGRLQQISLYLEGVVMKERTVANCYLHFENNGDIQIQLSFSVPVDEATLDKVVKETVTPYLVKVLRDLRQTGFTIKEYVGLRDQNTQVASMEYMVQTDAKKAIKWETIPGIYSLCTLNVEKPGTAPVVRLKRVENYQEMDAARILIIEMYSQVQYGDLDVIDMINELVGRKLVASETQARDLIAETLSNTNELNGLIVEKPGFPIDMNIDIEQEILEFRVNGLLSAFYLDTIGSYIDAFIKITQLYKETNPHLKTLKKICSKISSFKENRVEQVMKVATNIPSEPQLPSSSSNINIGPAKYTKSLSDDFFAQFDSNQDEDEAYVPPPPPQQKGQIRLDMDEEEDENDNEINDLLKQLKTNVNKIGPIDLNEEEDDEGEEEEEKEGEKGSEEKGESGSFFQSMMDSIIPTSDESSTQPIPPKLSPLVDQEQSPRYNPPAPEQPKEPEPENPVIPPTVEQPVKKGAIMFDDSDEEEDEEEDDQYGGATDSDEEEEGGVEEAEDDVEDEEGAEDEFSGSRLAPDGMKLNNPFLRRLKRRDPVLFATKPTSKDKKYKAFSVGCQPTSRHPVILTKEELDRTDKNAYEHSVKYGSDPNNQYYFICPRFWCFLTNSAISEEDVKAGKCGNIIPKGATEIPKGAYVYELNKRGQYPGFVENKREDGHCLPCCSKNWDSKKEKEVRAKCAAKMAPIVDGNQDQHLAVAAVAKADKKGKKKEPKEKKETALEKKTAQYIYSLDTYPVPEKRWGFLPIPVQLFLNMDYRPILDPNNPAYLIPGKPAMLRYGVEQIRKKSFLGCFAYIYAKRNGLDKVPSVEEFQTILSNHVNLDVFSRAHNGALLSAFMPKLDPMKRRPKVGIQKYVNTEFALGLDLTRKEQKRYLEDAILAYENFVGFITDVDSTVDHTYMWDFVCQDIINIIPRGLNLVVLEIKANDMIDRIELVCPTNLYSSNQFTPEKDTVILLKHDDVYEPIFMYEGVANAPPVVTNFFGVNAMNRSIAYVLKNVEDAYRKHCPGMPSLPRIYQFATPFSLRRLLGSIKNLKTATISAQVINYQGRLIGLVINLPAIQHREDEPVIGGEVYVPCAPAARIKDENIPIKYMDDLSIPQAYEHTTKMLNRVAREGRIPCRPVWKIKEGGMVVGFLTETNQFVPIKPNEDIIMDNLRTYDGVDHFVADKIFATTDKGDKMRIKKTKHIELESQFYYAFRNRVRMLLNEFENKGVKREIMEMEQSKTLLYSQKVIEVEKKLKKLIDGHVVFVDISEDVLIDMANVNECLDGEDESPNCIVKENGIVQLAIPKRHLISKYDNEVIYVGRLADELIRNDRVKEFMYNTRTRLNAQNVDYVIREDEFILVQSGLTQEYFSELMATDNQQNQKYGIKTNYEMANPSITVLYPNEKIPLDQQYKEATSVGTGAPDVAPDQECIVDIIKIVGNQQQIWKRIFPEDAKETIFRNTPVCSFGPILYIMGSVLKRKLTVIEVKQQLWVAYSALFERNPLHLEKVVQVLRKQGKSKMMEKIAKGKIEATPESFQAIVMSDDYYMTDMDIWALATEFKLPIIVFNPNGLKGFTEKSAIQWIKMGGKSSDAYYFIRSNIGSQANHIYEYNLISAHLKLEQTKEFQDKYTEAVANKLPNVYSVDEMLSNLPSK